MLHCLRTIAVEEGVASCWNGLSPALVRQVCYSSLIMVLYEPIRQTITRGCDEPNFAQRLFAGGLSGAISITVFSACLIYCLPLYNNMRAYCKHNHCPHTRTFLGFNYSPKMIFQ